MKTELFIASLTDTGKERPENQDCHAAATGNFGTISIVCDGMGGTGGLMAAQAAAEAIKQHFIRLSGIYNVREEFGKAFASAEAEINSIASSDPDLKGMGTTVLAVLVKDDQAYTAHLGDSRAYLIREDKLRQLTRDHSVVQQLIDAGTITEEQARRHPQRNVITRMLGAGGKSRIEYTEAFRLFRKDVIVLCSDGLTRHVSGSQILEAVKRNNIQDACRTLIKLANIGGGEDNITVQLIQVTKGRMLPIKSYRKKIKSVLSIFIPLAVLISSVILFSRVETTDTLNEKTDPALTNKFPEKVSFSGRAASSAADRQGGNLLQANTVKQQPAQKTQPVINSTQPVKFRIIKPGTNVRTSPDTHSSSVAILDPGSSVYSSTESREDASGGGLKWYRIKLEGGGEGWVRSDRFSVIK